MKLGNAFEYSSGFPPFSDAPEAHYNTRMENRVNKPKVFLSHAWENKPFVERIAADLRRCGIDYWLDTEEIRDGRSWLNMIFEDGIPACDAVIVYLTEQSIHSKMVQRELDAAVVQQLSEGGVNLLPYVSESVIRGRLRADIQTLQCREWNDGNYESILPTVVAEIWRSYLERTVETAVLQEKSRRLEQELENKRLKEKYESSVFSPREEQEFQYLRQQLGRKIDVTFSLFKKGHGQDRSKVGKEVCRVSVLKLLLATIECGGVYFDRNWFGYQLTRALGKTMMIEGEEVIREGIGETIKGEVVLALQAEVNTFGLTTVTKRQSFDRSEAAYEISEKMYRFKYWMEFNHLLGDENLDHSVTLSPEKPPADQAQIERARATAEVLEADKKISQSRRRRIWSTNGEGTLAATRDIQVIFDNLKDRVATSNEVLENIKLVCCADSNTCSVTTGDVILILKWNCPTRETVDCVLGVSISTKAESEIITRQVFVSEFGVKPNNELQLVWSRKDSTGDHYSLTKLTEYCWTSFIRSIQRNEDGLT
jgi:hypothetical protein